MIHGIIMQDIQDDDTEENHDEVLYLYSAHVLVDTLPCTDRRMVQKTKDASVGVSGFRAKCKLTMVKIQI